ncbi:hypothetical protein Dsin_015948 [Dipteronia sinensis]|uniref:Uncharacterized protein n=1 Tax=Dipteronia sinensis TaxID=43782 RepID=A0AAE0ADD5_9ROSI|nr:hypothetical protein Dsin_015948 [Dipteronia sinensis]
MMVKLFAQVMDEIRATERRITESFTLKIESLREEVMTCLQGLRNAPHTQRSNWTSGHHDCRDLDDGDDPTNNAQVMNVIKATERRMTESFTQKIESLHEEVMTCLLGLRNAPHTQRPNWTSGHHDRRDPVDGQSPTDTAFHGYDSVNAASKIYPVPGPQHMKSVQQGDVHHTEVGLGGGVPIDCSSSVPNIKIRNTNVSV